MTRDELRGLAPAKYLAQGYRDEHGRAWPELTSLWAAALAEQLKARGVSAKAFEQVVAEVAKVSRKGGAFDAVLQGGSSPAARELVRDCAAHVRAEDDRLPFVGHLGATLRVLALAEVLPLGRGAG